MRLRIVALGQRMPDWVAAAVHDYVRRMPRDFAVDVVELKAEPRDRGKRVAQVLAAEATRVAAACKGFALIALDERGSAWSTRELAERIARFRDDALDVAFVVGSADGLADEVRRSATAVVSLSALTLPHALARVIIAEQIYRAATLIAGHPYHRD